MEDWREAAEKFLEEWKKKEIVEGALVTGSYVAGEASKFSDVDIHIVLSDDVDWRERGNERVDGFLMEYFANPVGTLRKEFRKKLENNRRSTARRIHIGEIVFDRKGIVEELKEEAEKSMKKRFEPLEEGEIEQAKYSIWESVDDLKDLFTKDKDRFRFFSSIVIRRIYKKYAEYLRAEVYNSYRLLEVLQDEEFRENYCIEDFPDQEFADLCAECIREEEDQKKLERIKNLKDYVMEEMGGFDIDGWRFRDELE